MWIPLCASWSELRIRFLAIATLSSRTREPSTGFSISMINGDSDSEIFEALSRELLNGGLCVRFEARGASMAPSIRDGEVVHITPVIVRKLRSGDIVLTKGDSGFRVHRLVIADHKADRFITRGDCGLENDPPLPGAQILGFAATKEVKVAGRVFTVTL